MGLELSGSLANRSKTSHKAEPWHHLRPWRPQGAEAGLSVGTNSFSCQINWGKSQPVWPREQHRAQDLTSMCVDPSNNQVYWFSSFCPFFRVSALSKILTIECFGTFCHLKSKLMSFSVYTIQASCYFSACFYCGGMGGNIAYVRYYCVRKTNKIIMIINFYLWSTFHNEIAKYNT